MQLPTELMDLGSVERVQDSVQCAVLCMFFSVHYNVQCCVQCAVLCVVCSDSVKAGIALLQSRN